MTSKAVRESGFVIESQSMAKDSIISKLDRFLRTHSHPTEECHVMYLMVEMRKILDRERGTSADRFKILRFYCDWSVHPYKDRRLEDIGSIINELFQEIRNQLQNPAMVRAENAASRFAYMENLREEIRAFLSEHSLSTVIVENGWTSFVALLIKILEEQPIVGPIPEIKSVSFLPANEGCCFIRIEFTSPVNGKPSFDLGNAY